MREKSDISGVIPLAWAGSTAAMDYLNLGDALSPVIVALLTGMPIERMSFQSSASRLAAVGTIGHGFSGGETWFWGTGCSPWRKPSGPVAERDPFVVPAGGHFEVTATRGPISEALLTGTAGFRPGVYGDPVWLLPRFYRPKVKKRWKIGVILHLSELADRASEAHPRSDIRRFDIPEELAQNVHLITTVTPVDVAALGEKIDEILACERIVSTSLHGMVIAESYGIPCLYFAPNGESIGPEQKPLTLGDGLDMRIADLYSGLGLDALTTYVQPQDQVTDWQDVIAAIDRHWVPKRFDEERLIRAFPLPLNPVVPDPGQTIWQHPALTSIRLQHSMEKVTANDKAFATLQARHRPAFRQQSRDEPALEKQERLARMIAAHGAISISWVASTRKMRFANLGDALSAVVVAALSGLPVRHAAFTDPIERLVSVGTIGHAQKNGTVHFWGTGLDATRNPVRSDAPYSAPPATEFHVHATRGPMTAEALRGAGIEMENPAFGDPVSLLPKIWPMHGVEKTHDLGVIVHLTELDRLKPGAQIRAEIRRYHIPEAFAGRVKIIDTLTDPSLEALYAKVAEIVSCRAILSTSLHGLVLADAYDIPNAWFQLSGDGTPGSLALADMQTPIDHRMRDFFLGAGAQHLAAFGQDRHLPTDWQAAIDFASTSRNAIAPDLEALAAAFPLPLAPRCADGLWPLTAGARQSLKF